MISFFYFFKPEMEENTTEFFVVGKTRNERVFRLIHFKSTLKGWDQICLQADKAYDFQYVSKENVPDIMEWLKIDFTQYRMFDDLLEAEAYKAKKSE